MAVLIGAAGVVAGGCTGAASLREAPLDRGETLVVKEPLDATGRAARSALLALGYEIADDFRPVTGTRVLFGRVLGQGELLEEVRVVVREETGGESRSAVTVLCRRVIPGEVRVGGQSCEERVVGAVAVELAPRP